MPNLVRRSISITSFLALWIAGNCGAVSSSPLSISGGRTVLAPEYLGKYTIKIAAYDEIDNRQTFEDYAKSHGIMLEQLQARYASTGRLECGRGSGTANIVVNSSVIVTANHIICRSRVKPSECNFTYEWNGTFHKIAVKSLIQNGQTCVSKGDFGNDWAVLKLASPALGPRPYAIDPQLLLSTFEGTTIIAIGDHSIDFCLRDKDDRCVVDQKSNHFVLPKHIQDCKINYIAASDGIPNQYATNCAASAGNSGGPLLGNDAVLMGVIVSTSEAKGDFEKYRRLPNPIIHPFSTTNKIWATLAIPVNKELAESILRAASQKQLLP